MVGRREPEVPRNVHGICAEIGKLPAPAVAENPPSLPTSTLVVPAGQTTSSVTDGESVAYAASSIETPTGPGGGAGAPVVGAPTEPDDVAALVVGETLTEEDADDEDETTGAWTLIVTCAVAVAPFEAVILTETVCDPALENEVEAVGDPPVSVAKRPLPSRSHW
jgi:hypothetical protein